MNILASPLYKLHMTKDEHVVGIPLLALKKSPKKEQSKPSAVTPRSTPCRAIKKKKARMGRARKVYVSSEKTKQFPDSERTKVPS